MTEKILIGIPTYDKERYALVALLRTLQAQTHKEFFVLFVDNSDTSTPEGKGYVKVLEQALDAAKLSGKVVHIDVEGDVLQHIVQARTVIREYLLKQKKFTHLWFVDSDVLPPPHALERLLSRDRELVTGIYLGLPKGMKNPVPILWQPMEDGAARIYSIAAILVKETLPVAWAGLGCTLVTREIMEMISIRLNEKGKNEDATFYQDAIAAKVKPIADSTVRCWHLEFPLGDKRNDMFDLRKYKLNVRKKE